MSLQILRWNSQEETCQLYHRANYSILAMENKAKNKKCLGFNIRHVILIYKDQAVHNYSLILVFNIKCSSYLCHP